MLLLFICAKILNYQECLFMGISFDRVCLVVLRKALTNHVAPAHVTI